MSTQSDQSEGKELESFQAASLKCDVRFGNAHAHTHTHTGFVLFPPRSHFLQHLRLNTFLRPSKDKAAQQKYLS